MAVYTIHYNDTLPSAVRGGAATIGNFDGVHRGHQALLAALRAEADVRGVLAVAVTFDPHPLQLLRPDQFKPVLTTLADRTGLLQSYGADHVVVLRTTHDLLQLSARAFFDAVLIANLAVRAVVPGFNFCFGRDREGDVEMLAAFCREAGIGCTPVPPLVVDGRPVSSSRVRQAVAGGAVDEAARLLGRPYRVQGLVGTGQRRGQTLGFPTANVANVATLLPADGVYAVRAWHDGRAWPAAANVGPNPTFGEHVRKLEVHLIGFTGDLYGHPLAVEFLQRLRDTRPFAGPAELVRQLQTDVEQARRVAGCEG